ncbi:MAG TPA: hypothetical protein VFT49_02340 [Candidatus Saccharimonadales bacterium]|nr:hypothetical protein [Candidatus Saccharimonadales bacterium]
MTSSPIQVSIYHHLAAEDQTAVADELIRLFSYKPPIGLGRPEGDEFSINFVEREHPLNTTIRVVLPAEIFNQLVPGKKPDEVLRHSLNVRFHRDDFYVIVTGVNLDEEEEEAEEWE